MNQQPPPPKAPQLPWYEQPSSLLQPDEIDDLDRRLGRDKPKRHGPIFRQR